MNFLLLLLNIYFKLKYKNIILKNKKINRKITKKK